MRMKNDFHIKGLAPTLVLNERPGGTRKWPISWPSFQDDESRQILSLHVIRHKDLIVIKTSQREFVKRFILSQICIVLVLAFLP